MEAVWNNTWVMRYPSVRRAHPNYCPLSHGNSPNDRMQGSGDEYVLGAKPGVHYISLYIFRLFVKENEHRPVYFVIIFPKLKIIFYHWCILIGWNIVWVSECIILGFTMRFGWSDHKVASAEYKCKQPPRCNEIRSLKPHVEVGLGHMWPHVRSSMQDRMTSLFLTLVSFVLPSVIRSPATHSQQDKHITSSTSQG